MSPRASVFALSSLLLLSMSAASGDGRRMLAPRRQLAACGTGCLAAKLAANAVASTPTLISLYFNPNDMGGGYPWQNYLGASFGPMISYAICAVLACNYRNVTVGYAAGNGQHAAYNVVFYTLPGANATALPAALAAALPSVALCSGTGAAVTAAVNCVSQSYVVQSSSIAYQLYNTQGGAMGPAIMNVTVGAGGLLLSSPPPAPVIRSPPPPPPSPSPSRSSPKCAP